MAWLMFLFYLMLSQWGHCSGPQARRRDQNRKKWHWFSRVSFICEQELSLLRRSGANKQWPYSVRTCSSYGCHSATGFKDPESGSTCKSSDNLPALPFMSCACEALSLWPISARSWTPVHPQDSLTECNLFVQESVPNYNRAHSSEVVRCSTQPMHVISSTFPWVM